MKEQQTKAAIQKVNDLFKKASENIGELKKKESVALYNLNTAVNGPGNMNARNIAQSKYDTAVLERLFAEGDKYAYDIKVKNMTFELIQAIEDAKYKT